MIEVRQWRGVVLHHSLTPDGKASNWEAIRRFHVSPAHQGKTITLAEYQFLASGKVRGLKAPWSEIGYHYGVEELGGSVRLRIGRSARFGGAHTAGLNGTYLGLVIVGNFDKEAPSEEHLTVAALAVADLARFHNFKISEQSVRYHNEHAAKSCPGLLFPEKAAFLARIPSGGRR